MSEREHEHAKKEEKNHDHFTCLNANNQSMILMWCERRLGGE